jgi:hypothetical protein
MSSANLPHSSSHVSLKTLSKSDGNDEQIQNASQSQEATSFSRTENAPLHQEASSSNEIETLRQEESNSNENASQQQEQKPTQMKNSVSELEVLLKIEAETQLEELVSQEKQTEMANEPASLTTKVPNQEKQSEENGKQSEEETAKPSSKSLNQDEQPVNNELFGREAESFRKWKLKNSLKSPIRNKLLKSHFIQQNSFLQILLVLKVQQKMSN